MLYLNQHTSADTQVLALELRYIADRDVEILVPQIYGEESTQPKAAAAHKYWEESTQPKAAAAHKYWAEESLFQRLRGSCTPAGKEYRQRPNLRIDKVLAHPQALATMQEAIKILVEASTPEATTPATSSDETPAKYLGK